MTVNDGQFWLVLGAFVLAIGYLWRRRRRVRQGLAPACGGCEQCRCESRDA